MHVKTLFDTYANYGAVLITAAKDNHPKMFLDLGFHPKSYVVNFLQGKGENIVRVIVTFYNDERTRRAALLDAEFTMTARPHDVEFVTDFTSYDEAVAWFKSFLMEFPTRSHKTLEMVFATLDEFKKQRDIRMAFDAQTEDERRALGGLGHVVGHVVGHNPIGQFGRLQQQKLLHPDNYEFATVVQREE